MIGFKKWLQMDEVSTSTADVAHFSLPIGAGMIGRKFPQFFSVGQHGLGGPVQQLTDTDYVQPKKRKKRS
jgi:hypothetical protein